MTTPAITVPRSTSLPDTDALMRQHNIRRLPVVDDYGKLVGIVSRSDVREAQPSDATTLSIYELNYLLAKLTVDRVMTHPVLTVTPETTVAEAASLMLEHKLGGLPVMNGAKVIGIITESDIFRMVVKLYAE
ncbi:MAG: CBS domain-containing protein [Anaerolineae bacterium]|nr:CBS domain-containing protein [Anaerolineae bacterium]